MKAVLFLAAIFFFAPLSRAAEITLLSSAYLEPGTDVYGSGAGDAFFETRLLIEGADVDAVLLCGSGKPMTLSGSVPMMDLRSYSNQALSVREQLRLRGYSEVLDISDTSIEGACVELRNSAGILLERKTLAAKFR